MIKSVGQTFGYGAVKGYVNSSVSLHFCHAWQSPSTGLLHSSLDARQLNISYLNIKMQMCMCTVCLHYVHAKYSKPRKSHLHFVQALRFCLLQFSKVHMYTFHFFCGFRMFSFVSCYPRAIRWSRPCEGQTISHRTPSCSCPYVCLGLFSCSKIYFLLYITSQF